MAQVFSSVVGGRHLMALWYHFAIMFEALFILTTVDAGTRVGRFLVQAALKQIHPSLGETRSSTSNLLASALLVGGWGYFLYQGVVDPLGGINSLWPLFGIANQLLAVIALCLATTILLKMGKLLGSVATLAPLAWVTTVTFAAALQKVFSADPKVGFLAAARSLRAQLGGSSLPEARASVLLRTQFNLRVDAVVATFFLILVAAIVLLSLWNWIMMMGGRRPKVLMETPIVRLSNEQLLDLPDQRFKRSIQGASLFALGLMRQFVGEPLDAACANSGSNDACKAAPAMKGRAWLQRVSHRSSQPRCC